MRRHEFASFGLDRLELVERETPAPGPGEIVLDVEALSLNYRDLLVVKGSYNPNIALPATPVSDAAGTVAAATAAAITDLGTILHLRPSLRGGSRGGSHTSKFSARYLHYSPAPARRLDEVDHVSGRRQTPTAARN